MEIINYDSKKCQGRVGRAQACISEAPEGARRARNLIELSSRLKGNHEKYLGRSACQEEFWVHVG